MWRPRNGLSSDACLQAGSTIRGLPGPVSNGTRSDQYQVPDPLSLLGIPIHPVTASSLVEILVRWGMEGQLRRVFNVNVHAVNLAHEREDFRCALQRADVVFCDGFGVKWGAYLSGLRIPERLTPPDWIDAFAQATGTAGQGVFALGDEPGVAGAFQQTLRERVPQFHAAGAHHGFFLKEGLENDRVIDMINASGARHLLVGLGMPRQELWIERNAPRLQVRTAVAVGALFRWVSRRERRAPRWITDNGLEWLARLIRHPVRHFHRYVVGNPRFVARLLAERLTRE